MVILSRGLSFNLLNLIHSLNIKNPSNEINTLLPKELIKDDVGEKRNGLHTKRQITRYRASKTITSLKNGITTAQSARISIHISHDIVNREWEIEEKKVHIISHHSECEMSVFFHYRSLLISDRSFRVEYLPDHEEITNDHYRKRDICPDTNRNDIG